MMYPFPPFVYGNTAVMGSAATLFPWGNTPAPLIWTPANRLQGYVDGDPVGTWVDFSGNGLDLIAGVGVQPTFSPNSGPEAAACLVFSADRMTVPDLSALTSASLFLIFRHASPTNGNGLFLLTGAADGSFIPFSTDGNIYDSFFSDTRKDGISAGGGFTDAWHLYEVESAAGQWTNWLDRNQLHTTASNTVSAPTAGIIGFSNGQAYPGSIADLILFPAILSSDERSTMRAWIATEYGL